MSDDKKSGPGRPRLDPQVRARQARLLTLRLEKEVVARLSERAELNGLDLINYIKSQLRLLAAERHAS